MKNIIFLPGLGCDHRLFSHQETNLKEQYNTKVIVCDKKEYMSDHVNYVLENSPEKFIIVGHSFGGWIAQWIAIEAPERVSGLILIGTGTGKLTLELKNIFTEMKTFFENDRADEFFEKINTLVVHERRRNDIKLRNIIKDMQSTFTNKKLINQVNTDLEARDTSDFVKNIKMRTLIIHGRQDLFYEGDMLFLKNHIPNNNYVEIDDCGHMVPIEQPAAVTAVIKLWLDLLHSKTKNNFD